jgi:large subunit ribosomal protein L22
MTYKYTSTEYSKEHMARVVGRSLPISVKVSIEICNSIRKMPVAAAKTLLREVLAMKKAIKFTRFTNGVGHRKGNDIGAGRYPQKAASHILGLIETAEANAQFKGLNTAALIIKHISVQNAGNQWRYGRHRRRKMKRAHVELVLEEGKIEEKKAEEKKGAKPAVKKEAPKTEQPKPAEKKEAPKPEKKPEPKPAEKKEAPKEEKKPEPKKEAPKAEKKEEPKPKPVEKKPAEKKEQPKKPAEEKK